ncbi:CDP-6-deoxy-delta-3,4-glucoseen reductase [Pusillimonas sp. T7-7]|uniref:2Fe-2S iron-sulfur cluster-binding protein n=1 Tax=Pusillimonas sp. (strain T7-7) TaxID=1007105 RepID=UPI00020847A0|nr:2Fe-2S iron-sulfur cluster-binding protein [Pusillimonas sp. T7-7]AEC20999.1 CDP-6-deoxy-delta-3,4-glucoseen reductase [Pusillimonas sp. T7-7]
MNATINMHYQGVDHPLECDPGESVLYAALRQGVNVPYECATGTCGSCRAQLVSGEIQALWPEAPGNAALRSEQDILLCQSTCTTTCEIQPRSVSPEMPASLPGYFEGVVDSTSVDTQGLAHVRVNLSSPIDFLPGQFVLLAMDGVEGFRAYSPAHDGKHVSQLTFIVRRQDGGGLSPKLCSPDVVGAPVRVFGPLGIAHIQPAKDKDLAVVVGGSGIGVALALLDWAVENRHFDRHRLDVVCGLRSSGSIRIVSQLQEFAKKYPERLRIILALSEEPEELARKVTAGHLHIESGMAHEVAKRCLEGAWADRIVFVAGPPPMVNGTLRMLLREARVKPDRIRYDSFA